LALFITVGFPGKFFKKYTSDYPQLLLWFLESLAHLRTSSITLTQIIAIRGSRLRYPLGFAVIFYKFDLLFKYLLPKPGRDVNQIESTAPSKYSTNNFKNK